MNVLTAGESMPRAEYNAMLTELIAELKPAANLLSRAVV